MSVSSRNRRDVRTSALYLQLEIFPESVPCLDWCWTCRVNSATVAASAFTSATLSPTHRKALIACNAASKLAVLSPPVKDRSSSVIYKKVLLSDSQAAHESKRGWHTCDTRGCHTRGVRMPSKRAEANAVWRGPACKQAFPLPQSPPAGGPPLSSPPTRSRRRPGPACTPLLGGAAGPCCEPAPCLPTKPIASKATVPCTYSRQS